MAKKIKALSRLVLLNAQPFAVVQGCSNNGWRISSSTRGSFKFIFVQQILADLLRLSWVVFLHAALLSLESIVIEILIVRLHVSALVTSAIGIPLAGAILLLLTAAFDSRERLSKDVFADWKHLVPSSAFLAAGVFMWYDSVGRIGASKEGLLAGPFETVAILFLARIFLKERLNSVQAMGAAIAIAGFFLTTLSGHHPEDQVASLITFGDIEALLSAVSFAAGVIFLSKMAESHKVSHVTGASLLVSGLILLAVLMALEPAVLRIVELQLPILVSFSIIPLVAALTYVAGLARIGASLTSTIASFSIILTVLFQLIMQQAGIEVLLPERISLAVAGGMLGVLGIYLVHRRQSWKEQQAS